MLKIPSAESIKLKRGDIKLAHWPNGTICWIAKNLVDEIRVFELKAPWPTKIVEKFAKSKSYLY